MTKKKKLSTNINNSKESCNKKNDVCKDARLINIAHLHRISSKSY